MVDGHAAQGPEPPVDAPHDLVHQAGEALVLGHVGARGHSDLHQKHLVPPRRVLVQELLKGEQLLRDALDHVQAVHPQHHLAPREPGFELQDVGLHLPGLKRLREPLGIDPDGEGRHPRDHPIVFHPFWGALQPQDARARAHEVARVVVRVEPHEVRPYHPAKDLLSHRQRAVDLARGEGRVKEPPDLHVRLDLLEQTRQQQDVVVVAPDDVPLLVLGHDHVRELLVGLLVRLPLHLVRARLCELGLHGEWHVVEQLPQDRVAKPVVVKINRFLVKEDGNEPFPAEGLGEGIPVRTLWHEHPRPPYPLGLEVVLHSQQGAHEPSRAHVELPVAVLAPACRHRETVRDDKKPLTGLRRILLRAFGRVWYVVQRHRALVPVHVPQLLRLEQALNPARGDARAPLGSRRVDPKRRRRPLAPLAIPPRGPGIAVGLPAHGHPELSGSPKRLLAIVFAPPYVRTLSGG
mmetsp:Transcript_3289/g.10856  ORF Transcript_3289/g.10856 Transcript_3289/m.10856 type:complete len:463 (-) Transcript_3289:62-1450(-)